MVQVSLRLTPKMTATIAKMAEDREVTLDQMYGELVQIGLIELRRTLDQVLRAEDFVTSPSFALDGSGNLEK